MDNVLKLNVLKSAQKWTVTSVTLADFGVFDFKSTRIYNTGKDVTM